MEPNIRLQPQDTYLLVSKLDRLIQVCSKISAITTATFVIYIGLIVISFIATIAAIAVAK